MGRIRRVARRPSYGPAMWGGGTSDRRSTGAWKRRLHLLASMAPRTISSVGGTVDVGIYSGARTTVGGLAAVALCGGGPDYYG